MGAPRRRLFLPALLFVVGALTLALVSELTSSPLERALAALPVWVSVSIVVGLLVVGFAATAAYERLSRRPDDKPRPPVQRRALTRTAAVVAMVAAGAGGAVAGPPVFAWVSDSIAEATGPDWSAESLYSLAERSAHPVAFSRDGSTLAAGFFDGTVVVWDVATRARVILRGCEGISDLALAPDGRTVAVAGHSNAEDCSGGFFAMWDVRAQSALGRWKTEPMAPAALAFSPDGERLAVGGDSDRLADVPDGTTQLWDVRTRERVAEFTSPKTPTAALAFSPDGTTLATGGTDWSQVLESRYPASAALWDLGSGKQVGSLTLPSRTHLRALAFSPDGAVLATGLGNDDAATESVMLWDTGSRRNIATIENADKAVNSLAFTPDGRTLVVGLADEAYEDGAIELWDVATVAKVDTIVHPSDSVTSVSLHPDGRIASGDYDGSILLWTRGQL